LTTKRTRTTRPLRSSLITRPSPLLRGGPPPCRASVLSPSQLQLLGVLPYPGRRQHAPPGSSRRGVPTFRTGAWAELAPPLCRATARAVDRYPPGSSRSNNWTPVPIAVHTLSTLSRWFTRVRLLGPHLTHLVRLFRGAHHPGSFTGATHGGLQPPPAGRPRRAHLHHQHSTATISAIFYITTSSRARGAQSSAYLAYRSRR
jgi:hypothetical protein